MQRGVLSLFLAASCAIPVFATRPALGELTPESRPVKAAVQRGVRWLESASDPRLGAKALVGLVLLKNGAAPDHPKIVEAVDAIRKITGNALSARQMAENAHDDGFVYSVGLSVVFLTDLAPDQYRVDIEKLLGILEFLQKPHGGWGYMSKPTGDTSMTQYAVLAMWESRQVGIPFRLSMAERVLDWLLRTQDPSGGFGYQGRVATSINVLIEQDDVRQSRTAAGLGSVYVCADLLGLVPRAQSNLPAGIKEVSKAGTRLGSGVDRRALQTTKARGNQWLDAHRELRQSALHYCLYALERYFSFREDAEGESAAGYPWYDTYASYLLANQQPNGCWIGDFAKTRSQGSVPDTCFSLLFLLRSMKKSIQKARDFGSGLLVGGRGLPKGTSGAVLRGGQLVAKPLSGPGQQLIAALENIDSQEFDEAVEAVAELPADEARRLVAQHDSKLRALAQEGPPEARVAVLQAFGKSGDLDNVPTLIHALKDSDSRVVLAARDALRRISCKFDNMGLPDDFTEAQRAETVRRWKAWYLAVVPDAEFED